MRVVEFLKDFDIFSESIQFNANRQRLRKRTLLGTILTVSIILITLIYFIYQSYQYFSGQMDPKFRQQTFISDSIKIDLNNEMFGFDFFSVYQGQYLNQLQSQQNKTYIVFKAKFIATNSNSSINNLNVPLDIIKCQRQELQGMNCFDFSKLPNPQLVLKDHQSIFSYIILLAYKCQDVDYVKTEIPDNCADEQAINELINISPFKFQIKTQISQYNITANQIQQQYQNQVLINTANTFTYNELKIQNQVTSVQQGLIVQDQQTFSSPLSQSLITYTYDRSSIIQDTGLKCISQIVIDADESQAYFHIQFPIFTEVLALCNSTLAMLLLLGSFCRKLAQNFIRRDMFFILMKDFFSGIYLQIIQHNKIINVNNETQQNEIVLNGQDEEKLNKNYDEEHKKNIFIPSLTPKSSKKSFQQQQLCDSQNTCQDQVLEELQTQIQKPDDFLESLRINQDNIINKQTNIDKQSDYQVRLNLNKSDQSEKKYAQSLFRNIQQQQQQQQQFQLFTKDSSKKFANSGSITSKRLNRQNQTSQSNQLETQERETKNIKKYNEQINKIFSNLYDKSVHLKLEQMLCQFKLCKKKEFLQSKGLKQQTMSEVEQRIDESLDYYAFYKEILLIKKAIMIILSKQQLAALQVIGNDIEKQSKYQENSKMNYLSEEATENHFSEQYEILQSKELQLQYIDDFLKKCEYNRSNLDNIDKRILSSLLIYQQN
ncbi:AMP-binding enzyme family protein (macronuclear) [Tetrahymena thermophila SB210]|uniref:AMP-binding enzyme family protein n=1 Tax=Tetrahymena thermophila (strain SB210) TaxID=312017 RepID=W7X5U4_TETTS|nr:AMP-binding enzyme family protein [Tetrahymena thermophila SB210]EWS74735.1 AMP-binding enzyme family protein [Tetrahymena thermophila SB210]|eukprot:XP_012652736.1 AMP-binding enzyme family protein [Tetrahymena thermophila SB210]